ncbi:putative transmembrane protein [Paratrimastix pyriformis]|uniref:Transmembrane protein n=1 Tax=Paratrimastix pyriformis TaxID=342808 RepID=A0ABQ8UNX6_9EUKA|nr:putative transmembrane protein [Paratrimastix pyriformis]
MRDCSILVPSMEPLFCLFLPLWRATMKNTMAYTPMFFGAHDADFCGSAQGALLQHVANVAISMLIGSTENLACVWYFLSLLMDSFVGTLFCWLFTLIFQKIFVRYKCLPCISGNYGNPVSLWYWISQLLLWWWFVIMAKLIVLGITTLAHYPLEVAGQFLLSPMAGFPKFELVFVMMIAPTICNATVFWIQDSFLKRKSRKKSAAGGAASPEANADAGATPVEGTAAGASALSGAIDDSSASTEYRKVDTPHATAGLLSSEDGDAMCVGDSETELALDGADQKVPEAAAVALGKERASPRDGDEPLATPIPSSPKKKRVGELFAGALAVLRSPRSSRYAGLGSSSPAGKRRERGGTETMMEELTRPFGPDDMSPPPSAAAHPTARAAGTAGSMAATTMVARQGARGTATTTTAAATTSIGVPTAGEPSSSSSLSLSLPLVTPIGTSPVAVPLVTASIASSINGPPPEETNLVSPRL